MICEVLAIGAVTTLVRCFILLRIFDGDADAWLRFLQSEKATWADDDRDLLHWRLETEILNDPVDRIRLAVDEFESALRTRHTRA